MKARTAKPVTRTIPWMTSVQATLRMPPRVSYTTMIRARATIPYAEGTAPSVSPSTAAPIAFSCARV